MIWIYLIKRRYGVKYFCLKFNFSSMATLILKSLITGYALVALFCMLTLGNGSPGAPFYFFFIIPIFWWPATLIVSGLALLVYKAIEEQKHK